ncbi:hypothetical protein AwPolaro_06400 [Polaromonas sp.]|nr:hypothetical protein AwPolaro_06400 [Polaromonas sp.]
MLNWLKTLIAQLALMGSKSPKVIPETLWRHTLKRYSFLAQLSAADQLQLRQLVGHFLRNKEFSGANGLIVTDKMAVAIAAQACLPVLHLGLSWYDDFTGIVVHAGAMLARRESTDHAGVVHHYQEELLGEAMRGGPVTLSWQDAAATGNTAERGHNVVIHEFIHKIDMRDGNADGCPPLPSRAAYAAWRRAMKPAYKRFCEQVTMAERFGAAPPWLDAYGASEPAEFFAVTCEAFFMNRERFSQDFPELSTLFTQFFKLRS